MQETAQVADIRRGDIFTWNHRSWLATDDARPTPGFDHLNLGRFYSVSMVAADKLPPPGDDGTIDLGARILGAETILGAQPVEIRERGLQIRHVTENIYEGSKPGDALERVRHLAQAREAAHRQAGDIDVTFSGAIRRALLLDVAVADLAEAARLSASRIYQIRDGRR